MYRIMKLRSRHAKLILHGPAHMSRSFYMQSCNLNKFIFSLKSVCYKNQASHLIIFSENILTEKQRHSNKFQHTKQKTTI